jgi:hypothetical protein
VIIQVTQASTGRSQFEHRHTFISLEPIDLNKLNPEHDTRQVYKPMFSEQIWQPKKFDSLLRDIADFKIIESNYDPGTIE